MAIVRTPYGDDVFVPDYLAPSSDAPPQLGAPPTAPAGADPSAPSMPPLDVNAAVGGAPSGMTPSDAEWQPPQYLTDLLAQVHGGGNTSYDSQPPVVMPPKVTPVAAPDAPESAPAAARVARDAAPATPMQAADSGAPQLASKPLTPWDAAQQMEMGGLNDEEKANAMAADTAKKTAAAQQAAREAGYKQLDAMQAQQAQMLADRAKIRDQKQAQADALLAEADNVRIDENRRWASMGTGQKMGMLVSMALTGIGQAMMGRGHEQNPVIAMMDEAIKRDVQLQMDQRDQLRKRADRADAGLDKFDHFTSDISAQSMAMQAQQLQRTARQVELAAGQYGGDAARANGMKVAAELRERAGKVMQEGADKAYERLVKDQELANARRHIEIAGYSASLAAKSNDLAERKFAWDKDREQQQLDLEAGKLASAGKQQLAKEVQTNGIAGIYETDASGNKVPFIAQGTPESVEKLRGRMVASKTMIGLIDEARRIGIEHRTDIGNSKDLQQLQTIWAANKGVAKNLLELGALSESDYALLDKFLGTGDPTAFREKPDAVKQSRDNIIRMMSNDLKGHGYTGEWTVPDVEFGPPPKDVQDEMADEAKADPEHILPARFNREFDFNDDTARAIMARGQREAAAAGEPYVNPQYWEVHRNHGLLPSQQRFIELQSSILASRDPKVSTEDKKLAAGRLDAIANDAQTEAMRTAARRALSLSLTTPIPADPQGR